MKRTQNAKFTRLGILVVVSAVVVDAILVALLVDAGVANVAALARHGCKGRLEERSSE